MTELLADKVEDWIVAAYRVLQDNELLPTSRKAEALAYLCAITGHWPKPIPQIFQGQLPGEGSSHGLDFDDDIKHICSFKKGSCVKLLPLEQNYVYEGYRLSVKFTWFTPNINYVDCHNHLKSLIGHVNLDTSVKTAMTAHALKLLAYGLEPYHIKVELKQCAEKFPAEDRKEGQSCVDSILQASVKATIELAPRDHNGYLSRLQDWLKAEQLISGASQLLQPVFGLVEAE